MNMALVMVMLLLMSPPTMVLWLVMTMSNGVKTVSYIAIYIMIIRNTSGCTERPRRPAQKTPRHPPKYLRSSRAADFARRLRCSKRRSR